MLGTRLAKTIGDAHSLPITKRYFWTDSQTVLAWIRSDSRSYRQFVAFRIGEILNKPEVAEWHYVPSKYNVADDATKWKKLLSFKPESRWFTGPEFLLQNTGNWPVQEILATPKETQDKLRACLVHQVADVVELVDCTRFSRWERMHRTVGYVYRFIENCKKKHMQMTKQGGPFTQDELCKAEGFLIKMAQQSRYPDEVAILTRKSGEQVCTVERSSSLYKLSPVMDEQGCIRLDGRIANAPTLMEDTKYPMILPRDHSVTTLILDYYHRRYLHANRNTVLNEVRQRYYVPKLRASVERVIRQCFFSSKP